LSWVNLRTIYFLYFIGTKNPSVKGHFFSNDSFVPDRPNVNAQFLLNSSIFWAFHS